MSVKAYTSLNTNNRFSEAVVGFEDRGRALMRRDIPLISDV
jgi:hypothetical protein